MQWLSFRQSNMAESLTVSLDHRPWNSDTVAKHFYFTHSHWILLYHSTIHYAWWGFTAASDRQKLDVFIRRGVRLKFYSHDDPTMAELADELDETLFTAVLNNDDHVLRYILPDRRNNIYSLRPKRHELTLAIRRDSQNFFQRLLFKDMY